MKPRVFLSSTYFDLKHVRERIEKFIENYYLEAVLFESDNVIFEPSKPLDVSCYNEVKLCHLMILIIGGRYGSIVSGENIQEKKDVYEKEFISITKKEYETAMRMNIPVFVFIEKNVYSEYQTFKKNKPFFESQKDSKNAFSFAHVDDVNVFKFISQLQGNAIKTFEKVEEIENYIGNQISGFLFLYLQQLQSASSDKRILDSVTELNSISQRMNEMLNAVGKNVLKDEYNEVINNQNRLIIDFFVTQFFDNIKFENEIKDFSRENAEIISNFCFDTILNSSRIQPFNFDKFDEIWSENLSVLKDFKDKISEIDSNIVIKSIDHFRLMTNYNEKVYPYIKDSPQLMTELKNKMTYEFQYKLSGVPF
jgi:hypothetical protein